MLIASTISLAGNIQLALSGHERSPFAWLGAMAPPMIVLSTAYVIKEQILESIEIRHANERAFQAALSDWKTATSTPGNHPAWPQFHANALQDALRKANSRCKETLDQMTNGDWRMAVSREMCVDIWYQEAEQDGGTVLPLSRTVETLTASRNGNGCRPKVSASAV